MPELKRFVASLFAVVVLALGVVACGDDEDGGESGSSATGAAQTAPSPPQSKTAKDAARKGSGGKASKDSPSSSRSSSAGSGGGGGSKPSGKVYGDGSIERFGAGASDEDGSAAIDVAKAYYAARAAGDWKAACELMSSGIKQQLAQTFAQNPKLKAKGCPAVLTGLAGGVPEQVRKQEAEAIEFTEIRVKDDGAYAIFESKAIPHGFLPMAREDGEWKVAAIAGSSL